MRLNGQLTLCVVPESNFCNHLDTTLSWVLNDLYWNRTLSQRCIISAFKFTLVSKTVKHI